MTYDHARAEIRDTLEMIEIAITDVSTEAAKMGIQPHMLRDTRGGWPLHDLLHSKVQAFHSLMLIDYLEKEANAHR